MAACAVTTHNVRLVLAFTLLAFAARSLWSQQVLSAYVFLTTHGSNSLVGYITGVMGLAQVAAAPAGGLLGDKLCRRRALAIAGVLGLFAAVVTAAAVATGGGYGKLCGAGAAWGVFWAISNPSIEAVFADSVPDGGRTRAMTTKYVITLVASAAGPALAVAMFLLLGDEWTRKACAAVILAGVGLSVVPTVLLFFFRDVPAAATEPLLEPLLGEMSGNSGSYTGTAAEALEAGYGEEATTGSESYETQSSIDEDADREGESDVTEPFRAAYSTEENGNGHDRGDSGSSSSSGGSIRNEASVAALPVPRSVLRARADESSKAGTGVRAVPVAEAETGAVVSWRGRSWPLTAVVPAGVALSDVLSGLASGMSIKFFPIFFMENVALDPVTVSAIYAAAPLATAAVSYMAGRAAQVMRRRSGAVVFTKLLGISLLVGLCFLYSWGFSAWVLVFVFLVRSALMNCSKPLTRAIIMDLVPKHQRARWSALESVNMATWSGSAVVGGILVDRFGVLWNFYATAALQALALAPLLFVRRWEPEEGARLQLLRQLHQPPNAKESPETAAGAAATAST